MPSNTIRFEEGQACPVKIEGQGGGLSFSPNGDMLLVGAFPNVTEHQIKTWGGKWRTKLILEPDFPAIPVFAIGGEDWILEAPCNPADQERESPGFSEALYTRDEFSMVAVLVDSTSGNVVKISHVQLEEIFIERMMISWNPFRTADHYSKIYSPKEFAERLANIFKTRTAKQLWSSSW